jgi:hypothetical protein
MTTVATAMVTVTGSVGASCASVMDAASNRPALAVTTASKTPLTRGLHRAADEVDKRDYQQRWRHHRSPSSHGAGHSRREVADADNVERSGPGVLRVMATASFNCWSVSTWC